MRRRRQHIRRIYLADPDSLLNKYLYQRENINYWPFSRRRLFILEKELAHQAVIDQKLGVGQAFFPAVYLEDEQQQFPGNIWDCMASPRVPDNRVL